MTQIRKLRKNEVYEGNLILVNAQHPLKSQPRTPLCAICGYPQMLLQRGALALLGTLMETLGGWGEILPVSAWRSREEQAAIWDSSMEENGPVFTARYVAKPGFSEHQTGLAIDLGISGEHMDFIRPDFPYSGVCGEFRRRAARYGFVERYPQGKEALTGIAHEPWHFRFVGMPHAGVMTDLALTLEEYLDLIREYSPDNPFCCFQDGRRLKIFYLPAQPQADTLLQMETGCAYTLSGDNCGGFVVTQWGAAG